MMTFVPTQLGVSPFGGRCPFRARFASVAWTATARGARTLRATSRSWIGMNRAAIFEEPAL